MHFHLFEGYSRHDSFIHRLPAAIKLAVATSIILLVVLAPPTVVGLSFVALFLLLVAGLSRIPARFLVGRLLLLEPFVLGVAVLALFQPGGWRVMLIVMVKCTLCLSTTILLANTTSASAMVRVLQKIGAPSLMVTTLTLMYRYLFVLADEAQRMKRARASRTFSRRRSLEWRSASTIAGQLFIRAADRADRVYAAMCARGWR